jgi:hypothetical protein
MAREEEDGGRPSTPAAGSLGVRLTVRRFVRTEAVSARKVPRCRAECGTAVEEASDAE